MKKLFLILITFVLALTANAQGIYKTITNYDKFDDVISKRTIKTLVSLMSDDRLIIIETKGNTPVKYHLIGDATLNGSKESPVNLVDELWGYEEDYLCVPLNSYDAFLDEWGRRRDELNKSEQAYDEFAKKYRVVSIRFRTLTTQYTHDFITRLVWVKKWDGSRTVYNE